MDLLRRVVRDGLDVHAALGRDDEGDAPARPVDQQREVEFLVDPHAVGDVEPVDLLARGAGLDRYQRVAEHVRRRGADLLRGLRQPHAALASGGSSLNLPFSAPAGMDLRLHHIERPGQLRRRRDGLVDAQRGIARGHGDAEFGEQFLGLIFVDVHLGAPFSKIGNVRRLKHSEPSESTPGETLARAGPLGYSAAHASASRNRVVPAHRRRDGGRRLCRAPLGDARARLVPPRKAITGPAPARSS